MKQITINIPDSKYSFFMELIKNLGNKLAENPTFGTPLGNDVYKVRLAISSKGKGKSGGSSPV